MLAAGGLGLSPMAMAQPALQCRLELPPAAKVGEPLLLTLTLTNPSATALRVLSWNTPFEGSWWGPSVQVRFGGRALPYRGPSAKRGAPAADEYLLLPPHGSRSASLDLALPFALTSPGRYELRPQFVLHDVQPDGATAPAGERKTMTLACPTLKFTLL